jgi:hypothetical protein
MPWTAMLAGMNRHITAKSRKDAVSTRLGETA